LTKSEIGEMENEPDQAAYISDEVHMLTNKQFGWIKLSLFVIGQVWFSELI
jgi:hypothetical protein